MYDRTDDTLLAETNKGTYIGDGVYVSPWPEQGGIKLITHNGCSTTNTIYLDSEVLRALKEWLAG
jgi:hypothetical protein